MGPAAGARRAVVEPRDEAAARLRRPLEALRPNVETRTILEGQAAGIAVRYASSL
jgi:hypothetical protein